jgi:hypothetical protein
MLVLLLCSCECEGRGPANKTFKRADVQTWAELQEEVVNSLHLSRERIGAALGPEPPELPSNVRYVDNRAAVLLDGKRYALCLNDHDAQHVSEAVLGDAQMQSARGKGVEVPLSCEDGKPSIFGGKFARVLPGLLSAEECQKLIELSESQKIGYGLAGSRGFNPFARFAQRCLVDAPVVAAVITKRLEALLPKEYPPASGRFLVGVNERLRFLKYDAGMHHSGDHTDCAHEDPQRGRSFLTVQLYLNDSFCGGQTTFISDRLVPIEPVPGTAIIFDHELYHRGGMVSQGTKYAVRMDVLYGHSAYAASKEPASPTKGKGKSKRRAPSLDDGAKGNGRSHYDAKRFGRWGRQRDQ